MKVDESKSSDTTFPDPLIHREVDLRDFAYMPLDVVRFRDSDFTAITSGDAFRAGVLLWCASWHQVPAGSLPNDNRILANLAGFGRFTGEWDKVKEEALHGWVECNDGRIYHPTICEKALESWASKQGHRYTKFADRMRKANKKFMEEGKNSIEIPTNEQWISAGCPKDWISNSAIIPQEFQKNSAEHPKEFQNDSNVNPSNSELKGNIREHKGYINICPSDDGLKVDQKEFERDFEKFWNAYPKKQQKKPTLDKFKKINFKKYPLEMILAALEKQKSSSQWQKEGGQFIPMATTWINQERWNDQIELSNDVRSPVNTSTQVDLTQYVMGEDRSYG